MATYQINTLTAIICQKTIMNYGRPGKQHERFISYLFYSFGLLNEKGYRFVVLALTTKVIPIGIVTRMMGWFCMIDDGFLLKIFC